MPKKTKRSGAPARGYRYAENTSGRIPEPAIVPIDRKRAKLKPMRSVSSGTYGSGKAFTKINNRMRAK